ncbi:hypothetical protein NADFUDRAFT_68151 [Nadsonia fulvescens var. elongata DSM 6958]|uniref:Uncharacterized protein n=1 Tax=Nadsonia fulvescens var. elongata DSM 6958 TaxID=857566 RepID=A0A1E3PR10_9ASCO|nr:hypothetical protein NADFUDRAFT_68151 [Nadsonia fulvescens var. elongata DSM 6958]
MLSKPRFFSCVNAGIIRTELNKKLKKHKIEMPKTKSHHIARISNFGQIEGKVW